MNKKLIALLTAGILALGGVLAVVAYAKGADERAFGDAELTSVLVVTAAVPAGSPADRLAGSVTTTKVPKSVVAAGAVTDLSSLGGEVTNTALVPGEQLLAARFGTETEKADPSALPAGMQAMDLILAAPRVPAGTEAGDTVGVVVSYPQPDGSPGVTRMTLNKVRVMAVEAGVAGDAGAEAIADGIKVTFALTTNQAEKMANAAEFGKVWLTAQNSKADTRGSKKTDAKVVLG